MSLPTASTPSPSAPPSRRDIVVGVFTLVLWAGLITVAAVGIGAATGFSGWAGVVFSVLIGTLIGTVWLGGLRSIAILAAYPFAAHRERKVDVARQLEMRTAGASQLASETHVALLYCTANDFDADALAASMRQTHPGVSTVILDDSSDATIRREIDAFARLSGAHVMRRAERTGYKAGNLNHFFATRPAYDAFVILDSDEVLQPDFVERALARLFHESATRGVGVVQGRHRPHRGQSRFADEFGPMFETHVKVTQLVRSAYGFSFFMGRGALITAECVDAVGGFPEMVMEDLAFSLEVQRAGFDIVYAPELVSSEDYPVDYHAFKKQYGKFVEGATEFVGRYTSTIIRSRLSAAKKIDLLLDTVIAPAGAAFAIIMFLGGLLPLGPDGGAIMPTWMGATLAICGVAPLLGEVFRRIGARHPIGAAVFLGRGLALFASITWVTIRSTARVAFGKRAVFAVTPKRRSTKGWRATVAIEVGVACVALIAALLLTHSIAPALVFAGCAAAAWYLTAFSGKDRAAGAVGNMRSAVGAVPRVERVVSLQAA
ncbi:glycosyltransferase [Microbacterium oxydans]|uniref:glycosyltransferase n=1 Tax=Microbacterium oxydans TaxID=82380 RepID=UPI00226B5DD7|nr:glycosyltransferase [Microbacterium oxydans]WAA65616.1 glycosyltransferase [Microbacterium oxydans]